MQLEDAHKAQENDTSNISMRMQYMPLKPDNKALRSISSSLVCVATAFLPQPRIISYKEPALQSYHNVYAQWTCQ